MGVFHIELRLTSSGPRLIEINPRLMGASYDGKVVYGLINNQL